MPLSKLPLDSYTMTEIVRLHFLSAGSATLSDSKYDYQQRGGYTPHDDAGFEFCRQEPEIISALSHSSLFELVPSKCEIYLFDGVTFISFPNISDYTQSSDKSQKRDYFYNFNFESEAYLFFPLSFQF